NSGMIVKDSTAHSEENLDISITKSGRKIGFDFERSLTYQLQFAQLLPDETSQTVKSLTDALKEGEISLQESISDLSRVNQAYGLASGEKYSGKTQRWEGYVTEIHETGFTARLEDLTNPGTHEVITFDLEDISPDDESLLKLGATFYFSIGYVLNNGQREKTSLLRFKRIAEWTEDEFDSAIDRGK